MKAFIQVANRDAVPYASKPYIRILGLGTAPSSDYEAPVRLVERSTKQRITWTSVSSDLDHKSADAWNSWRSAISAEVHEAAQSRTMRSVTKARAAGLLQMFPLAADAPVMPEGGSMAKVISDIGRDAEVRGQTWASIGIIGDPAAAAEKEHIMEGLGTAYFEALKSFTGQPTNEAAEEHFFLWTQDKRENLFETLMGPTQDAHLRLRAIQMKPCVAVFDVSDDPDDLAARAKDLASVPELLHADIAIVRLYTWLALDRTYGSKHTARNPAAQPVFDAMRRAEENK